MKNKKNMPKYQVGMMNVIADDYTQKAKWDEGAYLYVAKVLDKEYLRHIAPEKTEEKIGIFDPSKIKVENIGVGNILINVCEANTSYELCECFISPQAMLHLTGKKFYDIINRTDR